MIVVQTVKSHFLVVVIKTAATPTIVESNNLLAILTPPFSTQATQKIYRWQFLGVTIKTTTMPSTAEMSQNIFYILK